MDQVLEVEHIIRSNLEQSSLHACLLSKDVTVSIKIAYFDELFSSIEHWKIILKLNGHARVERKRPILTHNARAQQWPDM